MSETLNTISFPPGCASVFAALAIGLGRRGGELLQATSFLAEWLRKTLLQFETTPMQVLAQRLGNWRSNYNEVGQKGGSGVVKSVLE